MGGDSEIHENWLGSVWRSVETMRYVVCELGQNNSGEQHVLVCTQSVTHVHRQFSSHGIGKNRLYLLLQNLCVT